jgi:L-threonylcarbamoyladenylate synthase
LARIWPGAVSVTLQCGEDAPEYLHRGTHTLAFRLPDDAELISFLKESGPCIAPSANPDGSPHAETIKNAREYFGDHVDFYKDGNERSGLSSTLIKLNNDGNIIVLRQGDKYIV